MSLIRKTISAKWLQMRMLSGIGPARWAPSASNVVNSGHCTNCSGISPLVGAVQKGSRIGAEEVYVRQHTKSSLFQTRLPNLKQMLGPQTFTSWTMKQ
eukprot:554081-Amphidinium_carterae.1